MSIKPEERLLCPSCTHNLEFLADCEDPWKFISSYTELIDIQALVEHIIRSMATAETKDDTHVSQG